jgi:hypothetical protein
MDLLRANGISSPDEWVKNVFTEILAFDVNPFGLWVLFRVEGS